MEQSVAPIQDLAAERERLARTWAVPGGIVGWLSAADHKTIGKRFIATAFGFFLLGGILAVLMRVQLAWPENTFVDPDLYNQLFSLHGTTMMFLFAVPVMEAMALYLVPLMIGTREIAFPRLAAFNYWVFLFGGVMIYTAFLLNIGPEAGWFSYVPLPGPEYSPGKRTDFWAQMITFTEISALGIAVQLIVTILKQRLRSDVRELLVTGVVDAEPDHRSDAPLPSIWPLLAALATAGLFIGSIFTPWAVPVGAVPLALALIGWFWPKPGEEE